MILLICVVLDCFLVCLVISVLGGVTCLRDGFACECGCELVVDVLGLDVFYGWWLDWCCLLFIVCFCCISLYAAVLVFWFRIGVVDCLVV